MLVGRGRGEEWKGEGGRGELNCGEGRGRGEGGGRRGTFIVISLEDMVLGARGTPRGVDGEDML